MLERVWRKGNPLTLFVGMQTSTATMENSVDSNPLPHWATEIPSRDEGPTQGIWEQSPGLTPMPSTSCPKHFVRQLWFPQAQQWPAMMVPWERESGGLQQNASHCPFLDTSLPPLWQLARSFPVTGPQPLSSLRRAGNRAHTCVPSTVVSHTTILSRKYLPLPTTLWYSTFSPDPVTGNDRCGFHPIFLSFP